MKLGARLRGPNLAHFQARGDHFLSGGQGKKSSSII